MTGLIRDLEHLDSLQKIIKKIPRECFQLRSYKSIRMLIIDYGMMIALGAMILFVDSNFLALPFSFLLGTVMTGLFVLGHDAGHRSFSYSERVNDIFGHIATTPLLWPFHVWRLSHDVHHRWTHHAEKEIAWRPLTVDEYQKLHPAVQLVYGWTRSYLYFIASALFQAAYIVDGVKGTFFQAKDRDKVLFSLVFTLFICVAYMGTCWNLGGFYGLFWLFVFPQLVYHFWLSTFTLFHHTHPEQKLMSHAEWSPEKAQLGNTIHVTYPKWVDLFTHDISWHIPHHVCVGIPFYNLRTAHRALKNQYPDVVCERVMNFALLKQVLTKCHVLESTEPGHQEWLSVSECQNRLSGSVNPSSRIG